MILMMDHHPLTSKILRSLIVSTHLVSTANEFWQVFKSVAASMFGVQTEKNRVTDFEKSSPTPFIIIGILFVIAFIATIMLVVQVAIS